MPRSRYILSILSYIILFSYFFIAVNYSYSAEDDNKLFFIVSIILTSFFILYFFKDRVSGTLIIIKRNRPIQLFIYFFVYSLISFILFNGKLNDNAFLTFTKVGLISIVFFQFVDSRQKLIAILISLCFSVSFMLVVYHESVVNSLILLNFGLNNEARFAGSLGNSNDLAMISLFSLWSSICLFIYFRNVIIKVLCALPILPSLYLIILSGSRKGLLSIIILTILILFSFFGNRINRGFHKKIIFIILTGIIVLLIVRGISNSYYGERFNDLIQLNMNNGSDQERLGFARASINMWKESPIWGKGFNNFRSLSEEYGAKVRTYSHSTLLEILANLGLIGVILYFGMYLVIFNKAKFQLNLTIEAHDKVLLKFILIGIPIIVFYNLFAVMYAHKVFIPLVAAFSGYIYSLKDTIVQKEEVFY